MEKISFIILNYKRPRNLIDHIIPNLLKNTLIDKIIISHALKETYFENTFNVNKILHLKHFIENEQVGLYCRFLAFEKSNTKCVVFQDDDCLVDNNSIKLCYEKWLTNRHSIHGFCGRNITKDSYLPYDTETKNVPIILTQFAMTSRFIIKKAIKMSPLINPYVQNCKPIWNGEDIFLNIVSILQTKKLNKKHNLNFKRLSSEYSISAKEGHYEHRTYLIQKLFEIFPELKIIFKLNNYNINK